MTLILLRLSICDSGFSRKNYFFFFLSTDNVEEFGIRNVEFQDPRTFIPLVLFCFVVRRHEKLFDPLDDSI